jgi:hypothetical protein
MPYSYVVLGAMLSSPAAPGCVLPLRREAIKTMHIAVVEIKVVIYVATVKLAVSNAFEQ